MLVHLNENAHSQVRVHRSRRGKNDPAMDAIHPVENHRRPTRLLAIRLFSALLVCFALAFFTFATAARYNELAQVSVAAIPFKFKFIVAPEEGRVPLQLAQADEQALRALGLTPAWYAGYVTAFEILIIVFSALIGVVVLWRRAGDRASVFAALAFILFGMFYTPTTTALVRQDPIWRTPTVAILSLAAFCSVVFCLVFPDGRFTPRWTRWMALVVAVWDALIILAPPFNPFTWPLLPFTVFFLIQACLLIIAQVYRYLWVSTPLQRQQTKWFVFGAMTSVLVVFAFNIDLPGSFFTALRQPGLAHVLYNQARVPLYASWVLTPPLAIAFAILRHRLWDIDLIIRRTVSYSLLTAVLALVYFGAIVLLQLLFSGMFSHTNQLAIAGSTLAIAALFHPLRKRIQAAIDRRFYRRAYDAEHTLAAFSAVVREETDLERLTTRLALVVEETLQPAQVWLWLRRSR
jgi:hypothetical protein